MKSDKNKLLTTVSAVALALAVGACSSSSSDDDEMAGTPPPPMMDGDGDAKTPAVTLADARDALVALPGDATDEAKEMAQKLVDEALRLPGNEAELIASLDAKVEQARMDAVAAQTAAEMATETAEQARMDAVAAQTGAEMAAATAEQDRMAAVTAQETAEMDAATAEQDRMAAVTAQETAEMAAATAEQDRMAAVTAQETAEMDAATAEQDRMAAVTAQETAEMAAATAEQDRMAAVTAQETAEMAAATAEQDRMAAVTAQETAEMATETAEQDRMAAVTAQETAEMAAATAEQDRMAAVTAQETAEMDAATAEQDRMAAVTAQETAEMDAATAEQDRMAAVTAQETAEMAAETAEQDRMAAVTAKEIAEMDAATAEMARAAAVTAAEEAETARAAAVADAETAEMARAAAVTAAEEAETARAAAVERAETAEEELAVFKEKNRVAIEANELADRIAREKAIKSAIEDSEPSNRIPDSYTAKAVPDTASGVTAVMATRNPAGMVTVDVNGGTDDVYAGGETTAGSGDWNSVTLTKTDAGAEATDTVVIYTDIDAPTDTLLTTVYLAEDGATSLLDQALTFDPMTDVMTDKRDGKAKSDGFPSGPADTWTYGPDGRAKSFAGTFDDVPGQFTCIPLTCTVMTDSMGKLTTSNGWRFTADAQNSATVKVADTGYAYFGWWLNKPKDNTDDHDVEVFAGGTAEHEALLTKGIVGTATYAGPAAGKYVTKTFSAGAQTDAGVGHFTANANLTAKFGTATDDDVGTIGGSVTGFVLDDGATPGWTVTLEDAGLTADRAIFSGMSDVDFGGGKQTGAGRWQGSFYDAAPATPAGGAPGAVAGTFDAVTENASVIGGFGATKQ